MAASKVAIITGAAKGLGKCFSEALLKNGGKVCIADVNMVGEDTAKELCEKYGTDSAFFIKCDVRRQQEFEAVFQETVRRYNSVDIVCNNAGIMHEGKWEDMVDINLSGVIRGTKLGLKYMGADKNGSGGLIVNVASLAGIFPMVFGPVYTASKHGVIGLTKAWANEPGYANHRVKMAALCPAIVDTDMVNVQPEQVTNLKITEKVYAMLGIIPPEKVAEAFMQLVEDEACNGKILTITTRDGIQQHKYVVGKSML